MRGWRDGAACLEVGPDLFHGEDGDSNSGRLARKICAACPVIAECLAFAVADPSLEGVWGGTSPQQRKRIRRAERRRNTERAA